MSNFTEDDVTLAVQDGHDRGYAAGRRDGLAATAAYATGKRDGLAAAAAMVEDYPFYALIQAAMRKADNNNAYLLRNAFPDVWADMQARYNAPGGILPGDQPITAEDGDEV